MAEATMKGEMFESVRKHDCQKPGNPWLGFAPLDFDVMKSLIERDASKEEISAQIGAWIAADATKSPNPAEPVANRFQAALMTRDPFAIYCGRCLETVCLIHPQQIEEGDTVSQNDVTPTSTDETTESRVIRGTCVAQVSEARWWVPSLNQTVNSVDKPTADAEFIKNVAYRQCGKPGVHRDEHADFRAEEGNQAGWLCAEHTESGHPPAKEEA
jgi:hypothetical protein